LNSEAATATFVAAVERLELALPAEAKTPTATTAAAKAASKATREVRFMSMSPFASGLTAASVATPL
jgi:hypothetical protein